MKEYAAFLYQFILKHAPNVLLAIIVLIIGWWLINKLVKALGGLMEKKSVEASLRPFLQSIAGVSLKTLLVVSVASMAGIETTSFVAVIGAAGLAIGLALQGSLANFAGGVLILLLKPFKVGDFITAQGFSGTVDSIQVFYTIIKTPNNQQVVIPNGNLANGSITNFSAEETRRLDLVFGISYDDNLDHAKEVLKKIVDEEERILKEPEPQIVVEALADSSVNFKLKLWTKASDYWNVNYFMQETVKKEFDRKGISFPYPQQDVYVYQKGEKQA